MSSPIPHVMKVGVEVWRMPPRKKGAKNYLAAELKEIREIVKWINSIRMLGHKPATFSNRDFDAPWPKSPHALPGPCIMISAQYSVWRANPGDYIVHLPEGHDKSIDVVEPADFKVDFTSV